MRIQLAYPGQPGREDLPWQWRRVQRPRANVRIIGHRREPRVHVGQLGDPRADHGARCLETLDAGAATLEVGRLGDELGDAPLDLGMKPGQQQVRVDVGDGGHTGFAISFAMRT